MIQQDTTSALLSDSLRSDSLQTVDSLAGNDSVAHLDTVVKIIEKRFDGILHPSFPQNEAWVFILLLVLFGMLIFSVTRSYGWLRESVRTFFQVKERSSIFSTATVNDFQSKMILITFSVGVISTYAYIYFKTPESPFTFFIWLKFLLVTGLFFIFKYMMIQVLGFVFLDKMELKLASTSYFNIISYLSILLFPLLIFQVYTTPYVQQITISLSFIVLILAAILVIIKLFQIFLRKIVTTFYILLYLCTLEILPLILLFSVYKLMT